MTKWRINDNYIGESIILLLVLLVEGRIIIIYRVNCFVFDVISFNTSGDKQKLGTVFLKVCFDKGLYGELYLYWKVCRLFGKDSVRTNIYLDNVNTDTKGIDVISISNQGIYVFEI
jgi:hypothetical protein